MSQGGISVLPFGQPELSNPWSGQKFEWDPTYPEFYGDYTPGLATVSEKATFWLEVWAYVDETDIGRISTGQNAFFTVDTYSDTDFEGRVIAIYPKAEIQNNVVNYIAVLKITEENGKILRPEMTTTVNIFLETKVDVLVSRLRQKLGDNSRNPKYIKTIWGSGYKYIGGESGD